MTADILSLNEEGTDETLDEMRLDKERQPRKDGFELPCGKGGLLWTRWTTT